MQRGDVVGECLVGLVAGLLGDLLAQRVESAALAAAAVILPDDDVVGIVVGLVGGEEAEHAAGGEAILRDDVLEHLDGLGMDAGGFLRGFRVFRLQASFVGEPDAAQVPGVEERGPVDVAGEFADRLVFHDPGAGELGTRRGVGAPIDLPRLRTRLVERQGGFPVLSVVALAVAGLQGGVLCNQLVPPVLAEQRGGHRHRA